eukprot:1139176-Pelagomonas_calceolata.AAC.6
MSCQRWVFIWEAHGFAFPSVHVFSAPSQSHSMHPATYIAMTLADHHEPTTIICLTQCLRPSINLKAPHHLTHHFAASMHAVSFDCAYLLPPAKTPSLLSIIGPRDHAGKHTKNGIGDEDHGILFLHAELDILRTHSMHIINEESPLLAINIHAHACAHWHTPKLQRRLSNSVTNSLSDKQPRYKAPDP